MIGLLSWGVARCLSKFWISFFFFLFFFLPWLQWWGDLITDCGFYNRVGSPKELFNAKGTFYDMVQHSGEVEDLEAIFAATEAE